MEENPILAELLPEVSFLEEKLFTILNAEKLHQSKALAKLKSRTQILNAIQLALKVMQLLMKLNQKKEIRPYLARQRDREKIEKCPKNSAQMYHYFKQRLMSQNVKRYMGRRKG